MACETNPMPRFRRRPRPEKLSSVLTRLAEPTSGSVTLADLLAAAGERSFGALLVLLAIPNMVAGLVPGVSMILGLPLLLVSLQLMVGAERPWLPRRLARLEIRRADLRRMVERTLSPLQRLERALKPRLGFLTAPLAERLIGLTCLGLSMLVFLPIPFANLLPATGILLLGFAMLERDGLLALVAFALAGAGAALFGSVAFAFFMTAGHTVRQLGLAGG
jgi:hypothetical protein